MALSDPIRFLNGVKAIKVGNGKAYDMAAAGVRYAGRYDKKIGLVF